MNVQTTAEQAIEKTVRASGNSGGVYVPKDWIGKKVKILLLGGSANSRNRNMYDGYKKPEWVSIELWNEMMEKAVSWKIEEFLDTDIKIKAWEETLKLNKTDVVGEGIFDL